MQLTMAFYLLKQGLILPSCNFVNCETFQYFKNCANLRKTEEYNSAAHKY